MGIMQRWKGKIQADALSVKRGGLIDPTSQLSGYYMQGVLVMNIQAVAALTTDFSAALPPGCTLLDAYVITTTAYTGATATLMLGSSAGDNSYAAATDVKTPGLAKTSLALIGSANLISFPALTSGKNIFARLTQTATTTAVGTSKLVLKFI